MTTKTWLEGVAAGGGRTARGASKVGLGFVRTVPGSIGVGEAIEVVVVASFDSVKPSLLDREAQAGMI